MNERNPVHRIAYIMHDRVGLSFAQCVQAIRSRNPADHALRMANRAIKKLNDATGEQTSLYDAATYEELFNKELDFAQTAHWRS